MTDNHEEIRNVSAVHVTVQMAIHGYYDVTMISDDRGALPPPHTVWGWQSPLFREAIGSTDGYGVIVI